MIDSMQDKRNVPFAMVEVGVLRNPSIKPQLKALYGLLITYGPERIFPGQQRLADEMGVTRVCIHGWLQKLRDIGLIGWEQRSGTSNLYTIHGLKGYKQVFTGGVNVDLHPGVNGRLHDLDPHDLDLPSERRADARSAPKAKQLEVFEWEMSDNDIHVIECPQCEGQVDIWTELSTSAAQCPHCGLPLQIKNSHGKVTHRPPQAARHRTRASPWLVAVEAFCERAGLEWAKVSGVQKGQWARSIAEVAGEGADPGEVAAAIRAMEIYDVANLKSPYQARFKEPLVIALARGEGSDLETVPLEELRARLAGGELRMDDLGAEEQAVVLARLGALP